MQCKTLALSVLLCATALTAGCSSVSSILSSNTPANPPPPANPSQSALASAGPTLGAYDCPSVSIRSGAATLAVGKTSNDSTATDLRYQVNIGNTARECSQSGPNMTIKVGMEGRVVVGPAGAPSDVVVPIRYALVREGTEPKTVWTQIYRVPVTMPPGDGNVEFRHVENDMTVPIPKRADLEAYVIYIGFDPQAVEPKKPARSRRR